LEGGDTGVNSIAKLEKSRHEAGGGQLIHVMGGRRKFALGKGGSYWREKSAARGRIKSTSYERITSYVLKSRV